MLGKGQRHTHWKQIAWKTRGGRHAEEWTDLRIVVAKNVVDYLMFHSPPLHMAVDDARTCPRYVPSASSLATISFPLRDQTKIPPRLTSVCVFQMIKSQQRLPRGVGIRYIIKSDNNWSITRAGPPPPRPPPRGLFGPGKRQEGIWNEDGC